MDIASKVKSKFSIKPKTEKVKNENSIGSRILASLQRLGKSLMYPIAVLPFAALLNRIGDLISSFDPHYLNPSAGAGALYWIGQVIHIPGATIFNNIALIFAIGCAFGLAKDFRGEAALVGGVAYMIMMALTAQGTFPGLLYGHVLQTQMSDGNSYSQLLYVTGQPGATPSYVLDTGVLGGITCGCIVAWLYNRYHAIQLPQALSFFGGRRFVPMVGMVAALLISMLFVVIYPWIQYVLVKFGEWIGSSASIKSVGAGLYGVVNRFMQPFGLHHILNTFLWFSMPIVGTNVSDPSAGVQTIFGDINAFQGKLNTSGTFTTGYFPMFLGGLPGAAVAMIFAASKDQRKQVWTFLSGVAFVAFLTGIDEPLAFSFIFVAPLLWAIHAIFTGILSAITIAMGMHIGFGFSAGFIDYAISFKTSWDISHYNIANNITQQGATIFSNPLWILPLSVLAFGLYFPTFYFLIKRLDIATPGRGANSFVTMGQIKDEVAGAISKKANNAKGMPQQSGTAKYQAMAKKFLEEIGSDNIEVLENCATRLRLVVKDHSKINDANIKAAGAYQIKRLGNKGYQIIVGTDVEHVADEMRKIWKPKK